MRNDKTVQDMPALERTQDFIRRYEKAVRLFMEPPELEVGSTPSEVVYQEGSIRLLHYLPEESERHKVPVLIVYALVNKPYILDLQPDRSVVKKLLRERFDVYMIDWGTPNETDKYNTLDDYVNWYIYDIVEFIRSRHGIDSITLLGYCMGGTLSVMFASLYAERVKNIILMASPLDFGKDRGIMHEWSSPEYFDVDKLVNTLGNVPGEFLNGGYLLLDPVGNLYSKYVKFIDKVDDEEFVKLFFRMERWLNDGIPVPGEAYREFLKYGYQNNLLAKSQFKLDGRTVELKNLTMPVLNLVAEYDNIVHPDSSRYFTDLLPSRDKCTIVFKTGHVGMSVSSESHSNLWPKVTHWLKKRSGMPEPEGTRKRKPRRAVR